MDKLNEQAKVTIARSDMVDSAGEGTWVDACPQCRHIALQVYALAL